MYVGETQLTLWSISVLMNDILNQVTTTANIVSLLQARICSDSW